MASQVSASTTAIARNATHLVLGQIATTALAIVLSAALGRYLGAEDFGLYYLVTTMSTFVYVFVEWGQPLYVIRHVAREPQRSGEMLGTALGLRAVFAPLGALLAWLIAWMLGYEAHTRWLGVLFIASNLPLFLSQGFGMVFRAKDQMGRDATVSVTNKALTLAVALPALAWGAGVQGVIYAQGVAGVAALGMAVTLYRGIRKQPLRASSRVATELLVGGAPILAMTAANWVQPYLDVIVLSKLAPAVVVGWLGAARNVLGTLIAPAVILGASSYPSLARASADPSSLRDGMRQALRPLLWLGALAGVGTYLFARDVIEFIYGARAFGPAATILEAFAPGLFLLFVDILLSTVIYASGHAVGFAIAKIASVAVGTLLDILLIPFFQEHYGNGGIGVVVAFALSELVVFAGCLIILPWGTLGAGTAQDIARAVASAGATLAIFLLLPPLPLWAGLPSCIVAFAAVSLALGLVSRRDLGLVWAAVKDPRREEPWS